MTPLLRMLEFKNLSLGDAEAAGFEPLSRAVQRCLRCLDTTACNRWLKWKGRYGSPPLCLNADYFDWLKARRRAG